MVYGWSLLNLVGKLNYKTLLAPPAPPSLQAFPSAGLGSTRLRLTGWNRLYSCDILSGMSKHITYYSLNYRPSPTSSHSAECRALHLLFFHQ